MSRLAPTKRIRVKGKELLNQPAHARFSLGLAYAPEERRIVQVFQGRAAGVPPPYLVSGGRSSATLSRIRFRSVSSAGHPFFGPDGKLR
jgi:hypothetical protein